MIIEDGRNRGKAYEADLRLHFLELKVRGTGRTTRLVDGYIQKLYRKLGEWVPIRDHGYTRQDDSLLERNILRRMEIEHQEDKIERRHHNGRIELRIASCPSKDEIARRIADIKNALHEMGVEINEDYFCV
jgi:hypothetical protein